jgi:hypothetical protein
MEGKKNFEKMEKPAITPFFEELKPLRQNRPPFKREVKVTVTRTVAATGSSGDGNLSRLNGLCPFCLLHRADS